MRWVRMAKLGLLLLCTFACLAAVISAYTVPADSFVVSLAGWLLLFAIGTWRFVALGYAARKRGRAAPGTHLDFVDEAWFNLVGIVGAGPFGAMLVVGSLNPPPGAAWKGLVFGLLGLLGALLSYLDLGRHLSD